MTSPSAETPTRAQIGALLDRLKQHADRADYYWRYEKVENRDVALLRLAEESKLLHADLYAALTAEHEARARDAEDRNNQALTLITILEYHGKHAAEMGEACLAVATQLRDELKERRAATRGETP